MSQVIKNLTDSHIFQKHKFPSKTVFRGDIWRNWVAYGFKLVHCINHTAYRPYILLQHVDHTDFLYSLPLCMA
jgi:hypothetical protein